MPELKELTNPVSGPVVFVERIDDFLELFVPEIRAAIFKNVSQPHVAGVCRYEVKQLDSFHCGHSSALIFGPGCTRKTAEEAVAHPVGDTPSRHAYPTHIFLRP